jgi:hypothetical protein
MDWILLAISLTTLLYVPAVAILAYQLKRAPQPCSSAWRERYIRSVGQMRSSLWVSFMILGVNALGFFLPALMGGTQGRLATIFGLLDLVCALVLYGVWRWAGWLRHQAISR